MDSILRVATQLWNVFLSLSPLKRVSLVGVAVASLLAILLFVFLVNQKEYKVLFANLSSEDAGKIVARLQEKKITYKISSSGDSILVPSEHVSELRLELAASGLPQGGTVGFEIFDEKNFGVTEFVQQLNYQRALQGELARTITSLEEIQQSRVHIVIPSKSLFVEAQAKPTASVILKLKTGRSLKLAQVEGITYLVARSVEGMSPEDVMVVDSNGNILSKIQSESQSLRMTHSQVEYQRNIEKNLVQRVQTMLERVVGMGKVVVRVSAALDFRVMERTEELYDPEEPVLRSSHRRMEKSQVPVAGGESTVNPANQRNDGMYNTNHEKSDEIVNYEINRVVSKTVKPVGAIERLSVAVLIDGIYQKQENGEEQFKPRSEQELKSLEEIVRKAVGFEGGRGDQVVVSCVPFMKNGMEAEFAEKGSWRDKLAFLPSIIKYVVILIAFLVAVFFVFRPLLHMVFAQQQERQEANPELPAGLEGQLEITHVPLELTEEGLEERMAEIEIVKNMVKQNPKEVAELLRNWLK